MPQVVVFEGSESRVRNVHMVVNTPIDELPPGEQISEYLMDCLLLNVGLQPFVDHKANAAALNGYLGYELTAVCIYPTVDDYMTGMTELAINGWQLHSGLLPQFNCKTFRP